MSDEVRPHTVCKGGEACYTAFFKKMVQAKFRYDERAFMQTVGKLILFRTIDAYYGKNGINLAGYKANMVAFTMSVLSQITNKALDFEAIWRQQSVITPSLYNELGGDMTTVYAKMLAGNKSITYKVKAAHTTASGKRVSKWEAKSIPNSELEKLKDTVLYKVMGLVVELQPLIWNHLMDVDEGTNISVNTKRASCWSTLYSKYLGNSVRIPSEILSSDEDFEMTPAMARVTEDANSYDYETWHDINLWGKETGLISPRDTAFMGSIYFWCKRGKELTYKQAKYAMRVLNMARAKGWEE